MKTQKEANEFGQLLISFVRDRVLANIDKILSGHMGGKENQILYTKAKNLSTEQQELIREYSRESVDSTLHYFLWMFEQYEEYDLIKYLDTKTKQFVSIRDASDGLYGELYTEEGWIEKFSKYPPSIE